MSAWVGRMPTAAVAYENSSEKVVCYYANWSLYREGRGGFNVDHIDPMLCSHVIYAYVAVRDKGTIVPFDKFYKKPSEKNGFYEFSKKLREINPKIKVMVALGGYHEGSKYFSQAVAKPSIRKQFINNIITFLIKYNFDGLDIDWMYPGQVSRGGKEIDKKNYISLLKELRKVFDHENLILSAAVGAPENIAKKYYNISELAKYLHFINLMTYDLHGKLDGKTGLHSPLYAGSWENKVDSKLNIHHSVQYWISQGTPPEKLVLGVPLYGISFTLKNSRNLHIIGSPAIGGYPGKFTNESGLLGYNEICEYIIHDKWQVYYQNEQRTPYAVKGSQWVGYDDKRSISEKVAFANYYGLGGLMVWSLDTDDFQGDCGEKYPLLKAINEIRNIHFDQESEVPEKDFEIQESITEKVQAPLLPNNNVESQNNDQQQVVQDDNFSVTDKNLSPNITSESESITSTTASNLKPITNVASDAESYEGMTEKEVTTGFDSKTNSSLQGNIGDEKNEAIISNISTTVPPITDVTFENNDLQTINTEDISNITKETSNIECIEIPEANKSENENDTTEVYLEDISSANEETTESYFTEFDETTTHNELSQMTTSYQEGTTAISTLTTLISNEKYEEKELENTFSTVIDEETTTISSTANTDSNSKSKVDSRGDIPEEEYEQTLENGTSGNDDIEIILSGNEEKSSDPLETTVSTTNVHKESENNVTVFPAGNNMKSDIDQDGKTETQVSTTSSKKEGITEPGKGLSPSHHKEKTITVTPSSDNKVPEVTNSIESSQNASSTTDTECIEIPSSIIDEYEKGTTEVYIDTSTDSGSVTTTIDYPTNDGPTTTEYFTSTTNTPVSEKVNTELDGKSNTNDDWRTTPTSVLTTMSDTETDTEENDEIEQTSQSLIDSTPQLPDEKSDVDSDSNTSEENQSNVSNDTEKDDILSNTTSDDYDTTSASNNKENDGDGSKIEQTTQSVDDNTTQLPREKSDFNSDATSGENQSNGGNDTGKDDTLSTMTTTDYDSTTASNHEENDRDGSDMEQTTQSLVDNTPQLPVEKSDVDSDSNTSEENQSDGSNDTDKDDKALNTTSADYDTTTANNNEENDGDGSKIEQTTQSVDDNTTQLPGEKSDFNSDANSGENQSNGGNDTGKDDTLSTMTTTDYDSTTASNHEENDRDGSVMEQTTQSLVDNTTQLPGEKSDFNSDATSGDNQSNGGNDPDKDDTAFNTISADYDTTTASNKEKNDGDGFDMEQTTQSLVDNTTQLPVEKSDVDSDSNTSEENQSDGSNDTDKDDKALNTTSADYDTTTANNNEENDGDGSKIEQTTQSVDDNTTQLPGEKSDFNSDANSGENQSNGGNDTGKDDTLSTMTTTDYDSTTASNHEENDRDGSVMEQTTQSLVDNTTQLPGEKSDFNSDATSGDNQSNGGNDPDKDDTAFNTISADYDTTTASNKEKNDGDGFDMEQTTQSLVDNTTQLPVEKSDVDSDSNTSEENQSDGSNDTDKDDKALNTTSADYDTTTANNNEENDGDGSKIEQTTQSVDDNTTQLPGEKSDFNSDATSGDNQSNGGNDPDKDDTASITTSDDYDTATASNLEDNDGDGSEMGQTTQSLVDNTTQLPGEKSDFNSDATSGENQSDGGNDTDKGDTASNTTSDDDDTTTASNLEENDGDGSEMGQTTQSLVNNTTQLPGEKSDFNSDATSGENQSDGGNDTDKGDTLSNTTNDDYDTTTASNNEKNDGDGSDMEQTTQSLVDNTTQLPVEKSDFNSDATSGENQSDGGNDTDKGDTLSNTTNDDYDTTTASNNEKNDGDGSDMEQTTQSLVDNTTQLPVEKSDVDSDSNTSEENQINGGNDTDKDDTASITTSDDYDTTTASNLEENDGDGSEMGQTTQSLVDNTTQLPGEKSDFNSDATSGENQSDGGNDTDKGDTASNTTSDDDDTTTASNLEENDGDGSEMGQTTQSLVDNTTQLPGEKSDFNSDATSGENQSDGGNDTDKGDTLSNTTNDDYDTTTASNCEENDVDGSEMEQTTQSLVDNTTQLPGEKSDFNSDATLGENQSNGGNDTVKHDTALTTTIADYNTTTASNNEENDGDGSETEQTTQSLVDNTTPKFGNQSNGDLETDFQADQSNSGSDSDNDAVSTNTTPHYAERSTPSHKEKNSDMHDAENREEFTTNITIDPAGISIKNITNNDQSVQSTVSVTLSPNVASHVTNDQYSDDSFEKTTSSDLSVVTSSVINQDKHTSVKDFNELVTNLDTHSESHSVSKLNSVENNSDEEITSTTTSFVPAENTTKQIDSGKKTSDTLTTSSPLSTVSSIHHAENNPNMGNDENPCNNQLIPGIAANPVDCSSFYKCQRTFSGTYMPFKIRCPNGLLFNTRIYNCDRAQNVVCPNEYSSKSNYVSGTTIDPFKKVFKGNPCNNQLIPGIALDPEGCSTFYKCQKASVAGWIPFKFYCPSGLLFNSKIFVCDWPKNVECHV
uniref:chitinase n=1 Tax=Trichogramma kaykai TaxID=54128 RepID=A0ABD2WTE2_9HYME